MGDLTLTLVNTAIFLVSLVAVGDLIIGAFLNARRETKGQPKKKRTSMIIFDIVMIALCLFVFQTINAASYGSM